MAPLRDRTSKARPLLNGDMTTRQRYDNETTEVRAKPLAAGDTVEVLSAREILETLGSDGKLEGLPFMPEMLKYCGGRFRVYQRAERTCWHGQPRWLESTVHLEGLRCDGSAHGDCGARCLLFWKEAWLRPVTENTAVSDSITEDPARRPVYEQLSGLAHKSNRLLVCQATEIPKATSPSALGNPPMNCAHLVGGLASGIFTGADIRTLTHYMKGKAVLFAFRTWTRVPWNRGKFRKTPSETLGLKPGDWVRVRSAREILSTLDRNACNRGMQFKPEMFRYSGKKFRVLSLLRKIVNDETRRIQEFRTDSIILDAVYCHGQRSLCTRSNYYYWREIWLQRC